MSSAFGQSKNYPYAVGINAGLIEYDGDLGQSAYSFKQAKPFVGLSFGYYISSRFDFAFNTSYGKFGYEEKHNLKFDSKLWQSNVHIRIKILDEMKHKAIPYLHIGIGAASYKNYTLKTTDGGIDVPSLNGNGVDVFLPFGGGIEYPLTERLKINLLPAPTVEEVNVPRALLKLRIPETVAVDPVPIFNTHCCSRFAPAKVVLNFRLLVVMEPVVKLILPTRVLLLLLIDPMVTSP